MSERLRAHAAPAETPTSRPQTSTRLPDRVSDRGGLPGRVPLDAVLARIHALPLMSPVVVRALQLTDREFIATREIVAVINVDPRFSARLVKAANAPCYGLPRPVTSVNEAVLLLGTDAFREVVLVAAAWDVFHRSLPGYGMTAADMWAHSIACGIAAEIAAGLCGYGNGAEAFLAGLLHDLGKIVLNEDMLIAAPFVRDQAACGEMPFVDAERIVLGYDHCDVGARVLRNWGIPQHIVQAVALHRKPVVSRQTVPLAGYVHLGEALCCSAGIGVGFEGLNMTFETQVLNDFKFTEQMADIAVSRLVDRLAESRTLLTQFAGPVAE
jgi:putative nucleotidyltransferase with HDIG domain